jgi:hypothetical protein
MLVARWTCQGASNELLESTYLLWFPITKSYIITINPLPFGSGCSLLFIKSWLKLYLL